MLPVVVRTGLPTLMVDCADLEVEGLATVEVDVGGDSTGAEEVTAGTVFTEAPNAANPPPKLAGSPVVDSMLAELRPPAELKEFVS